MTSERFYAGLPVITDFDAMTRGESYADSLIKNPATERQYVIEPGSVEPRGSHEGFECRWQDIPSRHGETVSLMVRALDPDAGRHRHFIDGADGGLFLAAKQFKERAAKLNQT